MSNRIWHRALVPVIVTLLLSCQSTRPESDDELEREMSSLRAEMDTLRGQFRPLAVEAGVLDSAQMHQILMLQKVSLPSSDVTAQEGKKCRYVCDSFYCCQWGPSGESPGTAKCLAYNPVCRWVCP